MLRTDQQPRYEVADVFRKHLHEYKASHSLSYEQHQAAQAIMTCRTSAQGGTLKVCDQGCGHWEFNYNSCKNRHCPKCGSFEKAQWLERQKIWLLPVDYYHLVFTIDHGFNQLVWWNKRLLYAHLIQSAGQLLKEYGKKYLGGEIGFTLILHTWGQQMQRHAHIHFIVTGGALVSNSSGYYWQRASRTYLFPVKKLSRDFRKAFCSGVRKLWKAGRLDTCQGRLDVAEVLANAENKDWEVYIQPPLCDSEKLIDYLGRYVFRIAISNYRIIDFRDGKVTFTYYDNRDDGKLKKMTLSAFEFIRRFLAHVLPSRFVRIRHFGLHHSSCRKNLQQARHLLGLPMQLPVPVKLKLLAWLKEILEIETDPRQCPACHRGVLVSSRDFGPASKWHLAFPDLLQRSKQRAFAAP